MVAPPQQSHKTKAAVGGVAIILASVALVSNTKKEEGRRHEPYRDMVGVWTVCDGVTGPDVVKGKTYTDAECNALTIKHLEAHGSALLDCINVKITQQMYDGLASWAYNVGVGAACKSTAIKLINAGRYAEGCNQLLRWNMAGGVPVRGLTLRRERERKMCIAGIPSEPYKGSK